MKKNHLFKGLTVIELTVVLSIIAIIAAAAVPSLSRYLPGLALNGSARTLTGNLREAQEKAITEQKQHLIRFFPSSLPPYYSLIKVENSVEEELKKVELKTSDLVLNLDISIIDNQIIFSPDGGPSSSGNITLTAGSNSKTVNVSPAGFISIQ